MLLQTATAEVVRPDNDTYSPNVRLVFDSRSQRSYITKDLKEKLKFPVIGRESLLIETFGLSDARLRTCEIVQVIFQKRVRVFHRGFKHEKTDESTRPQAECFYCFRVFETPMKHEARVFEITSPPTKENKFKLSFE